MRELLSRLRDEFRDEDYRYSYSDDFVDAMIATQIKVLREQRELSQAQLGERYGLGGRAAQTTISRFEDVDYSSWSVRTLRKIARALGVVLVVKFESFGRILREFEDFGRDSLQRPDFQEDPAFMTAPVEALAQEIVMLDFEGRTLLDVPNAASTVDPTPYRIDVNLAWGSYVH